MTSSWLNKLFVRVRIHLCLTHYTIGTLRKLSYTVERSGQTASAQQPWRSYRNTRTIIFRLILDKALALFIWLALPEQPAGDLPAEGTSSKCPKLIETKSPLLTYSPVCNLLTYYNDYLICTEQLILGTRHSFDTLAQALVIRCLTNAYFTRYLEY